MRRHDILLYFSHRIAFKIVQTQRSSIDLQYKKSKSLSEKEWQRATVDSHAQTNRTVKTTKNPKTSLVLVIFVAVQASSQSATHSIPEYLYWLPMSRVHHICLVVFHRYCFTCTHRLLISLACSLLYHGFWWCNNIWVVPVADGQLLRSWVFTAHTQRQMRAGGFDMIQMVGDWTHDLRESSGVSVREMIPRSQRRAGRNFTLSINFSHLS